MRVAKIAHVGVKVSALKFLRHTIVGTAMGVERESGDQDKRVKREGPDQAPKHVKVGHNTKA